MSPADTNNRGARHLRRIVSAHLSSAKGRLAIAIVCLVGAIVCELAAPWPIKIIFDHILLGKALTPALQFFDPLFQLGAWPALLALSFAIFLFVVIGGAFAYGQSCITTRIGHELTYELRRSLFYRLQRMPLAYHQRKRGGDVLLKFSADTAALKDLMSDWMLTVASQLVLVLGMVGIMLLINWRLALVVLLSLPILAVILAVLNGRIKRSLSRQRKEEGRITSRVNEVLSSIAVVQAFGREAHESARFEADSTRNLHDSIHTSRSTEAVAKAIALVSAAATAITVIVGAWQVLEGRMTPGDLLVFMAYLRSLYKPIRGMGKLSVKFSRALVSARRLAEILGTSPDIRNRKGAIAPRKLSGDIEFDDVAFRYADRPAVLEGVSFRIKAGQRVALVGGSGAGKSTIVNLILRLYDPERGAIRVDGIDVRDYQRNALRRHIGIVMQDTVLFGASIRENISYGRPEATDSEIEAAARVAHAHDFITTLPDRYETILGERGATLSGGQRQRICLARAIIMQPSILILDEPTASIDPLSVALIDQAVRKLQAGKTTLVISHQLSSMQSYDQILVLKDGRIIEFGSHAELLHGGGHYHDLVSRKIA